MPDDLRVQAATLHVLLVEIHGKTEHAKALARTIIETCDGLILEGADVERLSRAAAEAQSILDNANGKDYSGFVPIHAVEDATDLVEALRGDDA